MDFYGLARRQLQALCKLNKIPANMKNVAMADALSALDHVEGLDEIMQQQTQESVDSMTPATGNRTSTRARKAPVGVLESSGMVSRSRARTGKLVNDVSVEGEKKEVANTPAVIGRKRAPAASSRRKAELPSVQSVYSTRRSVRLLEKQLSELSLGESVKKIQAVKIDDELSSGMICSEHKAEEEATIDELEKCAEKVADIEVKVRQVSSLAVEAVEIFGTSVGSQFSDNGKKEIVATEEVEKPMTENSAEEVEGDKENANAGIPSIVISDVSDLGDVDAKNATPEKSVGQKPHNLEVVKFETVCIAVPDSLVKEDVDLKSSNDDGIELNKLTQQELQDLVVVPSKTVLSEVCPGSLVKEVYLKPSNDNGNELEKLVEQELQAVEIVESENISAAVPYSLDEEDVDLKSSTDQDNEVCPGSLVKEVYLKPSNDNGNELEDLVEQELQAVEVVESENISTAVPYSLDEEDVDLKSSADQDNEVERLSAQELQGTEVFHSKTAKDVVPYSLVEENLDLKSSGDLDNVVDKLVEQELQEVEVIMSETVSSVVLDSPVKDEVDLKSASEKDNEVVKDYKYDTVADQSFNATVDVEQQAANDVAQIGSQADKHDADLLSSTEEDSCITGDDAHTEIVSSPVKEVEFAEGVSQTTEPAATKEEHGTTCQVDHCGHDADRMIFQMSSPYQSSDHIEDKTDESNSLDTIDSSTDSVVHVPSQDRLTRTPNRWLAPALGASPHPKGQLLAQRNLIDRSPLATSENFNKENAASGLQTELKTEAPTTPLAKMSKRRLHKLLKARVTSAQETEEDVSKHIIKHHQPVKHRLALQTLPDNTLI